MSEEIGWNDSISEDDLQQFTVIPEGTYGFTITKFERKRFEGSAKVEECNMAVITAEIDQAGDKLGSVSTNLFMLKKFAWKLGELFASIGQHKHGQPLVPDWSKVEGATGRCKITIRKFKKKDGSDGECNDIKFLDPPEENTDFNPTEMSQGTGPSSGW